MKIHSVQDGDTLTLEGILQVPSITRIRLSDIDCPERGEPFYRAASDMTANYVRLLPVSIELPERHDTIRDVYNRLVAYVWCGDVLLQEALALSGYAVEFIPRGPAQHTDRIRDAIAIAQDGRRGIWSMPDHPRTRSTPARRFRG